jgi:2-polyprenyl-6-methoxyphenol hydroxylase-like FAD-dependent oxidoreductase
VVLEERNESSDEGDGGIEEVSARLVVLATGRGGKLQTALGFERETQARGLAIAGMLLDALPIDDSAIRLSLAPSFAGGCILFPLGGGRVRAYVINQPEDGLKLSGDGARHAFVQTLRELDPVLAQHADARPIGPLASFSGAAHWSPTVHRAGVALIGDAAGNVDPAFGCGLSLTARDARVLAESLAQNDNWQLAADQYSARRDVYYQAQLRLEAWMRAIIYTPGPQSDALREVALPRMGSAAPDLFGLGPDSPSDNAAREALFGPLAEQMP